MKTILPVALSVCAALSGVCAHAQDLAAKEIQLTIESQPLVDALNEWAQATGYQLIAPASATSHLRAPRLHGMFTPQAALNRLLDGTSLTYAYVDPQTIAIHQRASVPATAVEATGSMVAHPRWHLAGLNAGGEPAAERAHEELTASSVSTEPGKRSTGERAVLDVEEVVVTGTHIRGIAPIGSNLIVIDREMISRSGHGRIQDVLEVLPQNFSGSASEDFSTDSRASNSTRGQAIDLRGLGASSTLVLVNGRRQPGGGLDGSFVDISSIATSAVERIEIMPDGASAVYGSDAIGGVVNFVLRKDYDGLESDVRLAATDAGSKELRVSQLFGQSGARGNVLVGYQYTHRDPLMAADLPYASYNRDFRALGGDDFRISFSNPGTILHPTTRLPAFTMPSGQDGTDVDVNELIPGQSAYSDFVTGIAALPEQTVHSAFLTTSYQLGERVELFAEARYGKRNMEYPFGEPAAQMSVPASNPFYVNPFSTTAPVLVRYSFRDDIGGVTTQASETDTYALATGGSVRLGGDWQLSVAASYGREKNSWENYNNIDGTGPAAVAALADSNPATALNVFGDGANNNPATIRSLLFTSLGEGVSTMQSMNVTADGPLFDLPAGSVRLAVGTDYRDEDLEAWRTTLRPSTGTVTPSAGTVGTLGRHVVAAFGELVVPILGNGYGFAGARALDLAIAGRYEDYSDFGSTANPKIGINFSPISGLKLRGSWGTSFRAPRFNEISLTANPPSAIGDFQVPDPQSPSGRSNVLRLRGGNPDLSEETAEIWTAGFDLSPARFAGVSLSASYFSLDYEDKIQAPNPSTAAMLVDPQWSEIVARNPSAARIAEICGSPAFSGSCPPAPAAIVDTRLRNISGVQIEGVDIEVRYRAETQLGSFSSNLAGTRLLTYERALTSTAPFISVLDTVGNPLALRLRGGLTWELRRWKAGAIVNYTGAYGDTVGQRRVDSWTTVDATVSYEFDSGWMEGTRLQLGVVNVADREPPFVNQAPGSTTGGYDAPNASQVGRLTSFEVTKRW